MRHASVSSTSGLKGHTKMAPSERKHASSSACVIPGDFTGIDCRKKCHVLVSGALMYIYLLCILNFCFVSALLPLCLPSGIARYWTVTWRHRVNMLLFPHFSRSYTYTVYFWQCFTTQAVCERTQGSRREQLSQTSGPDPVCAQHSSLLFTGRVHLANKLTG